MMAIKDAAAAVYNKKSLLGIVVAGLLAAFVVARFIGGPSPASAQSQPSQSVPRATSAPASGLGAKAPAAPPASQKPDIVAIVNGERITRQELANESLRFFGEDVLESMVNKHLILAHCKQHGVSASAEEVRAEIDRVARRFNLDTEQWLQMLESERDIDRDQYANDIIWPTLALQKLAGPRFTVSPEELHRAYETEFGPAVKARIIVVNDPEKAQRIHSQVVANPDDFTRLAGVESEDINSAATGGRIQPIRRHVGDKQIEEAAFQLSEGEISPVIAVANQFVLLKCEGIIPARTASLQEVQPMLEERIREEKLPALSQEIFRKLQDEAVVENIFNDPIKSQAMPGIAAKINGHAITTRELAEAVIERHGAEVLEGMIDRKLLEQAVAKSGSQVTQDEMTAEIHRAAINSGITRTDGTADVGRWLEMITEQPGVTKDMYLRDVVWPTVALKKLAQDHVEVAEEDIRKGYDANYGPRVICRAIVLNNFRQATEVWQNARDNPSVENFAHLAEKFSIEIGSRSQGGQVPPIQKHGGQPTLEDAAFQLQANELSGVIQVGDKYVILFCEGMTDPVNVSFAEVRSLIEEDVREKKYRLAMAEEYDRIKQSAQIDNFLTGTSQSPRQESVRTLPAAAKIGAAVGNARR